MGELIPFKALHVYVEELAKVAAEDDGYLVIKYMEEGFWFVGITGIGIDPLEVTGESLTRLILAVYKAVM